jgi:filamentous hemagglutinin family protein
LEKLNMKLSTSVRALAGASLFVLGSALAWSPQAARAQGFAGTGVVDFGSATIDNATPGVTNVNLPNTSPRATITWTPTDTRTGGGPIDFLPNGNVVNYTGDAGATGPYTVLNRIIPTDPSRSVAFNGMVNSANNVRVFFYSPGGLLIGSTARFNVGGLLLSTSDLVLNGQNDFMPVNNQFSVAGAAGSTSAIEIQAGAEIRAEAVGQSNYIVAIAPRIKQDGLVSARGSVALVAAESADFAVDNQGLFNITVQQGSEVSNDTFTHTGTTGGPDAAGAGEFRRVYMVAVPKNNAISMAIQSGGTIGFDIAGAANVVGNKIILSAGHNIADTGTGDPIVATPAGNGSADILVSRGNYTSNTVIRSATNATVADTIVGGTSNISFASDLSVRAASNAAVRADQGMVNITGGVTISADAPTNGAAGTAILAAGGAGTSLAATSATVTANDINTNAFLASAGNASVQSAGGSIAVSNNISVQAHAQGAEGMEGQDGGSAFGGSATITANNGGTITVGGTSSIQAFAVGGNSSSAAGGNATAGTAAITATNGANIALNGGSSFDARATGGAGLTGGNASSGKAVVRASDSDVALGGVVLTSTNALAGSGEFNGEASVRSALFETSGTGRLTLGGAATGAAGDVTVAGAFGVDSDRLLVTLSAANNVAINANIQNSSNDSIVVLRADNGSFGNGTVSFGGGATVDLSGVNSKIDIYYNPLSFGTATDYSANILGGAFTNYQLVHNATQLQSITGFLGESYALARDIDLRSLATANAGTGFQPLGDGSAQFTGKFDGQGFSVRNLTINRPGQQHQGLFGYISGATIQNLKVVDATIIGSDNSAVVVGQADGGTFRNVHATGSIDAAIGFNMGGLIGANNGGLISDSSADVTVTVLGGSNSVGGLVGYSSGTILRSRATGNVTYTNTSVGAVGGLVGWNDGNISQSYATGNVTGTGSDFVGGLVGHHGFGSIDRSYATGNVVGDTNVGGFAGQQAGGTFSQSYASGAVTGLTNVGGFVGIQQGGLIENSYWDEFSSGQSVGFGTSLGTITNLNAVTSDPGQMGAANYAFGLGAYSNFSADDWISIEGQTRPILSWEAPVTVDGVTLINSVHQLGFLNSNLSGTYRLTQDINASETSRAGGIWGSVGFIPIGTDQFGNVVGGLGFTGKFDGVGHAISNLTITSPFSNVGLFGYTNGAMISNIVLRGGQITGSFNTGALVGYSLNTIITNAHSSIAIMSSGGDVGGLVGHNEVGSIVQDSSSSGTVDNIGGLFSTGGLVGYNGGLVRRSSATGSVNLDGSVDGAGGLVGFSDGFIDQSYSTASVRGGPSIRGVGGLVGVIRNGSVTRSYATGTVDGAVYVGGFVGEIRGGGSASENYATGRVNGVFEAGGFVGHNEGTVTNSYWDSFSTGQAIGVATNFGFIDQLNEVTSDPAQSGAANYALRASAYGNFDLNGTWRIYDGFTTPLLRTFLRPLTVSFADRTTVYDTTIPTLALNTQGADPAHLFGTATAIGAGSNVGTYSVTLGGGLFSDQQGFDIMAGAPATLNITPAPLTVIADAATRLYGDADPAFTFNAIGLLGEDALSGSLASTANIFSNVGIYDITQGTLNNANYAITFNSNALTITPRALSVTANTLSRLYGDTNPAFTFNAVGLVNGDSLTGALDSLATVTSNIGSYSIDQGTLAASANYALIYISNGASLNVFARPLSITADALSRLYGDTNPAFTFNALGLVNGDSLTGALDSLATVTSNVGTYAINQGTLSASENYVLSYNAANLDVLARPITITGDILSRVYGDANPALTFAVGGAGLVNGDILSGALDTFATVTSNVGVYAVTQGTLAASPNYALTYVDGALNVTPRGLTITADPSTRVYGDANPQFTYAVTGARLVNGDMLFGALDSSATVTSNVGTYAINQGTLTAGSNYSIAYVRDNLIVIPRALSVAANAVTRLYGDTNPAFTFTVTGLVNGDTLTGGLDTLANVTSNVGTYTINQGTLDNANYAISYTSSSLDVLARPITINGDILSRVYGDANPALTFTVGGAGLVNGDMLSGVLDTLATATSNIGAYAVTQGTLAASSNYVLSYAGANLGVTPRSLSVVADVASRLYGDTNPAFTFTTTGLVNGDALSGTLNSVAGLASNIGTYSIDQGTLGASANYALNYTASNLSVLARPITVTGDALSRIYGNANPALTFTVGGAGLVNGDMLSGTVDSVATAASNVGVYATTQGSLAASTNYAVTFTNGSLTVTPRSLSITADAATRIYGDANPAFTFRSTGLVNGDTLSGGLSTSAGLTSNVGNYNIGQGTLSASSNYVLNYTGSNLSVTTRSLSITADAHSRLVGGDNPALTFTVGGKGLVNGDSLTGGLSTSGDSLSPVGTYLIGQGSLAATPNYSVNFVGANLTVTSCDGGSGCAPPPMVMGAVTQISGDIQQQSEEGQATEEAKEEAAAQSSSDPDVLINSVIDTSAVNKPVPVREAVSGAGNATLWIPGGTQ